MTRRKNVPKKVVKKERPQTWDKKLKTLRKRYQQRSMSANQQLPKGGGEENTQHVFNMPNVVVGNRLRSHVLTNKGDR